MSPVAGLEVHGKSHWNKPFHSSWKVVKLRNCVEIVKCHPVHSTCTDQSDRSIGG